MQFIRPVLLATTILTAGMTTALADVKVVASIKPVHSLVAAVMQGVGTPDLIVEGAGSPHTYALKPSQAKQLQQADLVFWMSHDLEAFLEKSIDGIATKAVSIPLMESHGLATLNFREGGAFDDHAHDDHDDHDDEKHDDHDHEKHDDHEDEKHDDHEDEKHDDHDHEKHDDHDHEKHDDHDHEKQDDHDDEKHDDHDDEKHDDHDHKKQDDHEHEKHDDHDGHDDHGHEGVDPHVWLDPENAKTMVHEIEEALAKADPANAATYESNAEAVMAQLDSLVAEIDGELAPVKGRGYIVFHDAYQYFENRFGVSAIGSITVSPEVLPGAERVSDLQEKVRSLDATCVFSEPQFEPRLVATITENTNAGTGVLDPLGASIDNGPNLYFTLIRNMARSLKDCLSRTG
jgi:zinc transport system substrate-binding protein